MQMTALKDQEKYTDRYLDDNGIYSDIAYGSPFVSRGFRFATYLGQTFEPGTKVLCIGCGNGFEVVAFAHAGAEVYGTELHKPPDIPILKGRILKALVPNLPFEDKVFDLVFCSEVLEHIPEELTDAFLKECNRVSMHQYYTISTIHDPPFNTHINVHGPEWWLAKFKELDLNIIHFQWKPRADLMLPDKRFFRVGYSNGVLVYCE